MYILCFLIRSVYVCDDVRVCYGVYGCRGYSVGVGDVFFGEVVEIWCMSKWIFICFKVRVDVFISDLENIWGWEFFYRFLIVKLVKSREELEKVFVLYLWLDFVVVLLVESYLFFCKIIS